MSRKLQGLTMAGKSRRRICFVTGTRAEFGLMQTTLEAIRDHPKLQLQIVVTGMHHDARRGRTARRIADSGWKIDRSIPWRAAATPVARASETGRLTMRLARAFAELRTELVLVVGDRVEALAGATAGHLCDLAVAHVHGGDRALGQADDSLRHAITKLAHVHFPATHASARRILRLGEDRWRVHVVGAPGIDGIRRLAAPSDAVRDAFSLPRSADFALLVLHPVAADAAAEARRAQVVLEAVLQGPWDRVFLIYPNNDPGAEGIIRVWRSCLDRRVIVLPDLDRRLFLGLLRDAKVLVGNSSAGIIEAASFGLPVIDIGPRQLGREHGRNVVHCDYDGRAIRKALDALRRRGKPRGAFFNPSGGHGTGRRIAGTLASIPIDRRLLRKLIAY
ncbi:MAG: UDP-N-acetylglucosamine 2-epimerase [Phycisphaerae bacterium]|nr:UDP-N-acetylglucosamine 2-epimerase [Phycisphaerae bacterium]MDW8262836.1 UDP-N-acetylglucosamine 2-epimerase [Phycisphaerales bacterium]